MSHVSLESLVAAVKNYAEAHYNEGGWDSVVECYDTCDILEIITEGEPATTEEEAIRRVGEVVAVWYDRLVDVRLAGGLDENGREPQEKQEVSHTHCTCRDFDDTCEFCSYKEWMCDMKESGVLCEDGGFRRASSLTRCALADGGYHKSCFISQDALDSDIPF